MANLKDLQQSINQNATGGSPYAGGGSTGGSYGGAAGGGYTAPPQRRQRKKPPINWNMIKLNLTKSQIKECFDMQALQRGVKKEELPKYVNLDKLKQYFSEAQMRDMIDLDLFTGAAAASAAATTSAAASMDAQRAARQAKRRKKRKSFADKARAYERVQEERSLRREEFTVGIRHEREAEAFIDEGAHQKTVEEIFEEERVIEEIRKLAQDNPIFNKIIKKLNPMERKVLAISLKDIAESTAGPTISAGTSENEVVNGIIWSEILTPVTPFAKSTGGPLARR